MGVWYNWLNIMKLNPPKAVISYTIYLMGVDKIFGGMNSADHLKQIVKYLRKQKSTKSQIDRVKILNI